MCSHNNYNAEFGCSTYRDSTGSAPSTDIDEFEKRVRVTRGKFHNKKLANIEQESILLSRAVSGKQTVLAAVPVCPQGSLLTSKGANGEGTVQSLLRLENSKTDKVAEFGDSSSMKTLR